MDELTRRQIRYICFRLQTEAEGGAEAKPEKKGIMKYVDEVKAHMEAQEDFGGWEKFAKTWDVDDKAQLVIVKRKSSILSDWNKILKEQVKELPLVEEPKKKKRKLAAKSKKAPLRGPGGKFIAKSKSTRVSSSTRADATVDTGADKPKKKSFWNRLT